MTLQEGIALRKRINETAVAACAAAMEAADLAPIVCVVTICDATGLSTRIFCTLQCNQEEGVVLEVAVNRAVEEFVEKIPEIAAELAAGTRGHLRMDGKAV